MDAPEQARTYFAPAAGAPSPEMLITSKVIVRDTYAIIPASSIRDTVSSKLPGWRAARSWILAAPAIGFGTAFIHYLIYLDQGGGCDAPEFEAKVEGFVFVLEGQLAVTIDGQVHELTAGGYAFIPAGMNWAVVNRAVPIAKFMWIRKAYEPNGDHVAKPVVGNDASVAPTYSPVTRQKWTSYLIPTDDMAYDMHMNIISFGPGMNIPFIEAHIMEHGLYMLQGRGLYLLNEEWHEVEAGDFIWMRAFCPQAFQASGDVPARYLLYKNVNRQLRLTSGT